MNPTPDTHSPEFYATTHSPASLPPPLPSPARILFEYAHAETLRLQQHTEMCLSMALHWKRRAELAHERLLAALSLAETAAQKLTDSP